MADGAVNYVVDANVYITAFQRYYAFDLVGSFWKALKDHGKLARVVSIDRVMEEMAGRDDELSRWVKDCSLSFIKTDRPDVIHHYGAMQKWAQSQDFLDYAKAEFAEKADAWLVADAKAGGHTVVTLESFDALIKSKVKIPNVCKAFGVQYMDTFAMLRALGIKLG